MIFTQTVFYEIVSRDQRRFLSVCTVWLVWCSETRRENTHTHTAGCFSACFQHRSQTSTRWAPQQPACNQAATDRAAPSIAGLADRPIKNPTCLFLNWHDWFPARKPRLFLYSVRSVVFSAFPGSGSMEVPLMFISVPSRPSVWFPQLGVFQRGR